MNYCPDCDEKLTWDDLEDQYYCIKCECWWDIIEFVLEDDND